MKRSLLIIEDDPGLQKQMRWCIEGAEVNTAGSLQEAEALLRRLEPQVVTLDLGLPPDPGGTTQGFACLELIQKLLPDSKVVVITGQEDREFALRAVASGAYDYYHKPIESETLRFVVERAFRLWELESDNRRLSAVSGGAALEGLITGDPGMLALCRQVEKVAPTDATITILGETGTGKEIVARNIHRLSDRQKAPFIAINCAAIPENLLESELFGHEKGAFTGAVSRKIGRVEAANGGTLFLDEIGDMPLPLQAKILRFLQERSFERVGGSALIPVDVRVLCATHHPIDQQIAAGVFREDLYYRLSEIVLTLPPLKDRGSDSALLAKYFLKRSNRDLRLGAEALAAIEAHTWNGNVRELENRIKRATILSESTLICPADLELTEQEDNSPINLKTVRATAERGAIQKALLRTGGNVSQSARLLGVSRPTLYNLFEKYDLDPETGQ